MEGFVILFIYLAFAICCALIAPGRGRSAAGWFVIGFFFNLFALIVLMVLPDLKVQEEQHRRLRTENRRLRERVRKDRQIADGRHRDASDRLNSHDRALGVDTSSRIPGQSELRPPPLPEGTVDRFRSKSWYFVGSRGRVGPVSYDDLRRNWSEGVIASSTLVWNDDMEDWKAVWDLEDLEDDLRG